MSAKIPRTGSGQFQWNGGGWFGSQIGGTLWMLIIGFTMLGKLPAFAWMAIGLALGVNGLGFWLWSHRHRLAPYPCIQTLVATVALATLILLVVFDGTGHLADLDTRFRSNPRGLYLILLMFPVLMGMFHFQNRQGKRK
jgi:hypothetical protein